MRCLSIFLAILSAWALSTYAVKWAFGEPAAMWFVGLSFYAIIFAYGFYHERRIK